MGSGRGVCAATTSKKRLAEAQEAQVSPADHQVLFAGVSRGHHSESGNDAGMVMV